jgi:quinol monooxygenase YgiN
MAYAVAARLVANEGWEGQILEGLKKLAAASREESGCAFYQPTQDPKDPRVFFLFEIYADETAFDAHVNTPHFNKHAVEGFGPHLAERDVVVYETID